MDPRAEVANCPEHPGCVRRVIYSPDGTVVGTEHHPRPTVTGTPTQVSASVGHVLEALTDYSAQLADAVKQITSALESWPVFQKAIANHAARFEDIAKTLDVRLAGLDEKRAAEHRATEQSVEAAKTALVKQNEAGIGAFLDALKVFTDARADSEAKINKSLVVLGAEVHQRPDSEAVSNFFASTSAEVYDTMTAGIGDLTSRITELRSDYRESASELSSEHAKHVSEAEAKLSAANYALEEGLVDQSRKLGLLETTMEAHFSALRSLLAEERAVTKDTMITEATQSMRELLRIKMDELHHRLDALEPQPKRRWFPGGRRGR